LNEDILKVLRNADSRIRDANQVRISGSIQAASERQNDQKMLTNISCVFSKNWTNFGQTMQQRNQIANLSTLTLNQSFVKCFEQFTIRNGAQKLLIERYKHKIKTNVLNVKDRTQTHPCELERNKFAKCSTVKTGQKK
jgi:hypothetical protein